MIIDGALPTGIFAIVAIALFIWWIVNLIDALRTPTTTWQAAGQSQVVYILLMALVSVIGTIAYVVVARPQLRKVSTTQRP